MNITAVSVAPIFKDHIHGGSQRVFMDVTKHMADKGHKIRVFCTRRRDNHEPFTLGDNMEVFPVMRYRETFPMPYMTAPYNLAEIIETIDRETRQSDLLYVHADGFLFKNFFHGNNRVNH